MAMSESSNFSRICDTLSKVTGKKIVYRQAEPGEMAKNDPVVGQHFEQMYEYNNDHGFGGDRQVLGAEEVGRGWL